MPDRDTHLDFDILLVAYGFISKETNTDSVHDRLDRGVSKYGPNHREEDDYHSEQGIRDWLDNLPKSAYQTTLTDLLRSALGHLVLDEIDEDNREFDKLELFLTAFHVYIKRGYDKRYYKARS
jgi:hypothetical protein